MLALPYFVLFELLGPLFQLTSFVVMPVAFALGLLDPAILVAFAVVAVLLGVLLSVAALALEEFSFRRHRRGREAIRMLVYAVLENFGFRQLVDFWRLQALWDVVRRKKGWGDMKRKGFAARAGGADPLDDGPPPEARRPSVELARGRGQPVVAGVRLALRGWSGADGAIAAAMLGESLVAMATEAAPMADRPPIGGQARTLRPIEGAGSRPRPGRTRRTASRSRPTRARLMPTANSRSRSFLEQRRHISRRLGAGSVTACRTPPSGARSPVLSWLVALCALLVHRPQPSPNPEGVAVLAPLDAPRQRRSFARLERPLELPEPH